MNLKENRGWLETSLWLLKDNTYNTLVDLKISIANIEYLIYNYAYTRGIDPLIYSDTIALELSKVLATGLKNSKRIKADNLARYAIQSTYKKVKHELHAGFDETKDEDKQPVVADSNYVPQDYSYVEDNLDKVFRYKKTRDNARKVLKGYKLNRTTKARLMKQAWRSSYTNGLFPSSIREREPVDHDSLDEIIKEEQHRRF